MGPTSRTAIAKWPEKAPANASGGDARAQVVIDRSPKQQHLVTNAGDTSAVFLVLQGIGEHDFVPLT
jgi:hypothetical protein